MPPAELPGPGFPAPLAFQRVIRCLRADIEATQRTCDLLLRPGPPRGDLSYLDRLIRKPWGSEFRVYEDQFREVWSLHIMPGHRTSLHCHPNKFTAMLCLDGKGTLRTCTGVRYALEPGVVLHIEPGAYHRSVSSRTGLWLIEVETPKDKFDLLRIEDDYRKVTEPYEGEYHAPLRLVDSAYGVAMPLSMQPFVKVPIGAPGWARLRASCSTSRYRFAVEAGERVRTSIDFKFAVGIEPHATTPREVTVLGPERAFAALPKGSYLTIRNG